MDESFRSISRIEDESHKYRFIHFRGVNLTDQLSHSQQSFILSKFFFITWVSKLIWDFFSQISNFWFLIVLTIYISATSSQNFGYLTAWFLSVFFLTSLFINLMNDKSKFWRLKKRYQAVQVWNGGDFKSTHKGKLEPGDLVLVKENQEVPADLLLLGGSEEPCECWADVRNILGEVELDIKQPLKKTQMALYSQYFQQVILNLQRLEFRIKTCTPQDSSKRIEATLLMQRDPVGKKIQLKNILLKGSVMRKIKWTIGVILYPISQPFMSEKPQTSRKFSNLQKKINKIVFLLVGVQIFLTLVSFLVSQTMFEQENKEDDYLNILIETFLMFSYMIPIGLFFSLDVVRLVQSLGCYHKSKGIQYCNSQITDMLGQVEYILADKSGTITQNELTLQACILGQIIYWRQTPQQSQVQILCNPNVLPTTRSLISKSKNSQQTLESLITLSNLPQNRRHIIRFLTCMAICNDITHLQNKFISRSESDKVLVKSAYQLGMQLIHRSSSDCILRFFTQEIYYSIVAFNKSKQEFNRTRILLINQEQSILFVIGQVHSMINFLNIDQEQILDIEQHIVSDNIIGMTTLLLSYRILTGDEFDEFNFAYNNAKLSPVNSDGRAESVFQQFEQHLEYLGLVCLQDMINEQDKEALSDIQKAGVKVWLVTGDSEESVLATGAGSNLFENHTRVLRIIDVQSESECNSLLNDHIKENIYHIHNIEAKQEAYSENESSSRQKEEEFTFNMDSSHFIKTQQGLLRSLSSVSNFATERFTMRKKINQHQNSLHPFITNLTRNFVMQNKDEFNSSYNPHSVYYIVSIDGTSLEMALNSEQNKKMLVMLLFAAQTVFLHGLAPSHKEKVVKMLKANLNFKPVVMAIGDADNNISMIKEAHIGVCVLSNQENLLKKSSDIIVRSFRQVRDLVLYHGQLNFLCVSQLVNQQVYLGVLLASNQFLYNLSAAASGTWVFNVDLLGVYLVLANILPTIINAVISQGFSRHLIDKFPEIHQLGVHNSIYNKRSVIRIFFIAIVQSLWITISYYSGGQQIFDQEGLVEDQALVSLVIFLMVSVSSQVTLLLQNILIYTQIVILYSLSIVAIFCSLLILNFVPDLQNFGVLTKIFLSPTLVLLVLMGVGGALILQQLVSYMSDFLSPSRISKLLSNLNNFYEFYIMSRLQQFSNSLSKVYKALKNSVKKTEQENFQVNPYKLQYLSSEKQKEFKITSIIDNLRFHNIMCVYITVLVFVMGLLSTYLLGIEDHIALPILTLIIMIFECIFSLTRFYLTNYFSFMLFHISILITKWIFDWLLFQNHNLLIYSLLPFFYFIVFRFQWFKFLIIHLLILPLLLFISFQKFYTQLSGFPLILTSSRFILAYLAILLISILIGYNLDKSKMTQYSIVQRVYIQIDKSKTALSFLLPQFVTKRVGAGQRSLAEDQGHVSVIFCNICNFQDLLQLYSPQQLIAFLDQTFSHFDDLCNKVGATKIQTVGKTYLACCGLRDGDKQFQLAIRRVPHARRAIQMGFALIRSANGIYLKNRSHLQVKIGIHSGNVTAGVVGLHKPQFSLVGDTVNTASRMATTNTQVNSIQISVNTFELINDPRGLSFTPNVAYVKGKGDMETFTVRLQAHWEAEKSKSVIFEDEETDEKPLMSNQHTKSKSLFIDSETIWQVQNNKISLLGHLGVIEARQLFRLNTIMIEEIKWFSLTCRENTREREFRQKTIVKDFYMIIGGLLIYCLHSTLQTLPILYLLIQGQSLDQLIPLFVLQISLVILGVLILKFGPKFKLELSFAWILQFLYIIQIPCDIAWALTNQHSQRQAQTLTFCLHLFLLAHCSPLFFKHTLWSTVISTIQWLIYVSWTYSSAQIVWYIIYNLFFTFLVILTHYKKQKELRIYFNLKSQSQKELTKTEQLNSQMMPPPVFKRFRQGFHITDRIPQVTITYADIVGFTAWSSDKMPAEIINMLTKLFTRFDKQCQIHNVYKAHTIGDCYVALSYTGNRGRDFSEQALNIINFAESMIHVIEEVNDNQEIELKMRIGVHTGDVIGGLPGTNIVRYDLYGIDVAIANECQSNGIPGAIVVSEVTKNILENYVPDYFSYEFQKEIPVNSHRLETIGIYRLKRSGEESF